MTDRVLAKLIESVNRHLPERKQSLKALINSENPTIKARDGNEYYIEKEELEFIAKFVEEFDWDKFYIPIILEMTNLGEEYVIYVRDKRHAKFLEKAFGFNRYSGNTMLLYTYEMQKIRRKLKTTTQVMFRV
uniref:UPF0216 protein ENL48_02000 n=1 Tax=Geoglobus ahangari TaxID=113653 RepID=A0A7C4S5N3_9EURY